MASFLSLNGIDVPIANGQCQMDILEVGGQRLRAYDGTLLTTVRGVKREWKCKTPILSYSDADFYSILIRGDFQVWGFTSHDLYSAKGVNFSTPGTGPSAYADTTTTTGFGTYTRATFPGNGGGVPAVVPVANTDSLGWLAWFQQAQDGTGNYDHWCVISGTVYKNGSVWTPTAGLAAPYFYPSQTGRYPFYGSAYPAAAWAATTAYTLNTVIVPTTNNAPGNAYIVTVAGTSAGASPTWSATAPSYNNTLTDGTVTWKNIGPSSALIYFIQHCAKFVPSVAQVAKLVGAAPATTTLQLGGAPIVAMTGDAVQGQDSLAVAQVIGQITNDTYVQAAPNGTWSDNCRVLEFTLQEV